MFRLFPTIESSARHGPIRYNDLAREWLSAKQGVAPDDNNPLLDAAVFETLVTEYHREHGLDWSYGGYLESREAMLGGSYLQNSQNFLHLGVDFSVPAKTAVAVTFDGMIVEVDDDRDNEHGWGPRVIVVPTDSMLGEHVFLYAHLDGIAVRPGLSVAAGTTLGVIGNYPENGNWWPHLHLQCVRREDFDIFRKNNFKGLDGYGHPSERERLAKIFPDPLPILGI